MLCIPGEGTGVMIIIIDMCITIDEMDYPALESF